MMTATVTVIGMAVFVVEKKEIHREVVSIIKEVQGSEHPMGTK